MPYSIPYDARKPEISIRRITNAINDLDARVLSGGGGGGAVDSVNGETGVVVLDKGDVGLGNADNTSDANKPVSTATQTALSGKANLLHTHTISDITGLQSALDAKQDAGANNSYFPQGW